MGPLRSMMLRQRNSHFREFQSFMILSILSILYDTFFFFCHFMWQYPELNNQECPQSFLLSSRKMSWLRTRILGSARLRFSFQFCHNLRNPSQYDHSTLALATSGLPLLEVAGSHSCSHSHLPHSVMLQCRQFADTQTFLASWTEAVTQAIPIKDDVPRCTYKIFHRGFTHRKFSHCESGSQSSHGPTDRVFHEWGGGVPE